MKKRFCYVSILFFIIILGFINCSDPGGGGDEPTGPEINIKQGSTDIASGTGYYNFGSIGVGETSSAVIFTIENKGTSNLILSGSISTNTDGTAVTPVELSACLTEFVTGIAGCTIDNGSDYLSDPVVIKLRNSITPTDSNGLH